MYLYHINLTYQEAFRIAAGKAMAAADSMKVNMTSKAEDIGGCVSNPTPTDGDLKDIASETAVSKPVILNLLDENKLISIWNMSKVLQMFLNFESSQPKLFQTGTFFRAFESSSVY